MLNKIKSSGEGQTTVSDPCRIYISGSGLLKIDLCMWTEQCCDGAYVSQERKGGSELEDESKRHINTPSEGLLFLKILRLKNRLERGARQRGPGGLRAKSEQM